MSCETGLISNGFTQLIEAKPENGFNFGDNERILLSVGHLVERKGHHLAIEALTALPKSSILVIAGSGPDLASLKELAEAKGLTNKSTLCWPGAE